jgi:hypothetical protein
VGRRLIWDQEIRCSIHRSPTNFHSEVAKLKGSALLLRHAQVRILPSEPCPVSSVVERSAYIRLTGVRFTHGVPFRFHSSVAEQTIDNRPRDGRFILGAPCARQPIGQAKRF